MKGHTWIFKTVYYFRLYFHCCVPIKCIQVFHVRGHPAQELGTLPQPWVMGVLNRHRSLCGASGPYLPWARKCCSGRGLPSHCPTLHAFCNCISCLIWVASLAPPALCQCYAAWELGPWGCRPSPTPAKGISVFLWPAQTTGSDPDSIACMGWGR